MSIFRSVIKHYKDLSPEQLILVGMFMLTLACTIGAGFGVRQNSMALVYTGDKAKATGNTVSSSPRPKSTVKYADPGGYRGIEPEHLSLGSYRARPEPPRCTKKSFSAATPVPANSNSGLSTLLQPKIEKVTYPVYGYTPEQIKTQLNTCRPNKPNATRNILSGSSWDYYAGASWAIDYDYKTLNSSPTTWNPCRLRGVVVSLSRKQVMPEWTPNRNYDVPGLSNSWQRYKGYLERHQTKRADLAKQYSQNIFDSLKNYEEGPKTRPENCDETKIAEQVQSLVKEQRDQLIAEINTYDQSIGYPGAKSTLLLFGPDKIAQL